jgi:hypothetical protein
MTLHRLAAGLCLLLLLTAPPCAEAKDASVPAQPQAVKAKKQASPATAKNAGGKDSVVKDALDALPEWEQRYVKETRITIENNIDSLMEGIHSRIELTGSIETFQRTWEKWEDSKLFILEDDRDIDVYGNLYSLQVMCRTLRLAASDWNEFDPSDESRRVLEKAKWLEQRSRRLAEPVAEIIRHQSYSSYLPRRIEIMQDMLPYVDICYKERGFGKRMK